MKLTLENLEASTQNWLKENPVLLTYLRKEYFKTKRDMENLHQFHSPYIVPKGLTALQVRRRINSFAKNGNKNTNPFANTHRVNIFVDDKFLSGTTYGRPITNHRQFVRFLKDLLSSMKAPKRPLPKGL